MKYNFHIKAFHKKANRKKKDQERELEIKKFLGCKFFRIPEEQKHLWREIIQCS